MGTPDFAATILTALIEAGHHIRAVYTQPPRPAGRGHLLHPSAVQTLAEQHGLPVHCPATLRHPAAQAEFAAIPADAAIVVAYGLLLPKPVLNAPRLGCINVHASLLPRWRGAAPIQRAILEGDAETGITLFRMEEGLDTGPVFAMRSTPIGPRTTAPELHDRLAALAAEMAPEVLDGIAAGTLVPIPQPEEGVTYAAKLRREEGEIDFTEPATLIERRLRALNPWPGCHTSFGGERLSLLQGEVVEVGGEPGMVVGLPLIIACGEGVL